MWKAGLSFRAYQNALLVLAADGGEAAVLRGQVKRWLALRAIAEDKRLVQQLSEENRFLTKIAPGVLLWHTLPAEQSARPLREIVESFRRYPHLPMLEGEMVARQAVAQGVREGAFGVRVGERVYWQEVLPDAVWEADDAALVRREVALAGKAEMETPPAGGPEGPGEAPPAERRAAGPAEHTFGSVLLRFKVPWDRLSDVVRGVVLPLHHDNAYLEIELSIRARAAPPGIRKATLEQKVEETLRQIGAQVLEERQE